MQKDFDSFSDLVGGQGLLFSFPEVHFFWAKIQDLYFFFFVGYRFNNNTRQERGTTGTKVDSLPPSKSFTAPKFIDHCFKSPEASGMLEKGC